MSCSVSVYLIVSYSYAENTETELQSFIIHSNLLVLKLQHIYSHLGICLQFLQMELQIKSAHSRTSLASILSRLLFVGVMLRYSGQLLLRLAAEGISLARFRPIVKKKKKGSLNASVKSSVMVIKTPFPLTPHVIWVLKSF